MVTIKSSNDRDGSTVDSPERRSLLKYAALGGGTSIAAGAVFKSAFAQAPTMPGEQTAQAAVDNATRGMAAPRIKDLTVFEMSSGSFGNYVIVKVTTDQAGLFGYGEASVEVGSKIVRVAVEEYLKPLVVGRTIERVDDIWRLCYLAPYYKNDYIMNTAISGVCDALWDIKGRLAGVPVHQLVGGKVRDAAEVYMHAGAPGLDPAQLVEAAKKLTAQGVQNILITMTSQHGQMPNLLGKSGFDRDLMNRTVFKACEAFRRDMPENIRLGLDVGSKLDGARAAQFCKDANQFKPLLYVEDVVPPEGQMQLRTIREQTATPMAFGELWNNPHEWRPMIEERLVDYIRPHISHIGGFTPALKLAASAAPFGVKTAWHAIPITPLGQMARVTLDVVTENFGVHEIAGNPSEQIKEIFPGGPEIKGGYAWVSDKPGWGVEFNEALAAKLPPGPERQREIRQVDGYLIESAG